MLINLLKLLKWKWTFCNCWNRGLFRSVVNAQVNKQYSSNFGILNCNDTLMHGKMSVPYLVHVLEIIAKIYRGYHKFLLLYTLPRDIQTICSITQICPAACIVRSSHLPICLFCTRWFLSFFSSSWCQGLAAACDCGTPWTFLLTFLIFIL